MNHSNTRQPCAMCGRLNWLNYNGVMRKHYCVALQSHTVQLRSGLGTLVLSGKFNWMNFYSAERDLFSTIADAVQKYESFPPAPEGAQAVGAVDPVAPSTEQPSTRV